MFKGIAVIGYNHKGDFKLVKEMIKIAIKLYNVGVLKFQKYLIQSNNSSHMMVIAYKPKDIY